MATAEMAATRARLAPIFLKTTAATAGGGAERVPIARGESLKDLVVYGFGKLWGLDPVRSNQWIFGQPAKQLNRYHTAD